MLKGIYSCIEDKNCIGSFNIPLQFELGKHKKKKYSLNLNTYRNLHYQVNNALKIKVKDYIKEIILHKKELLYISEPVEIEYIIYPGSKRRMDLDNTVVIAKYTQDALVELGILVDDDYKHVVNISFRFGGLDPNKQGYVEISIKGLK